MSRDLRPIIAPISLSIPDAAAAVGYSETVLKEAINRGDLVPRYENTKGVIPADELLDWVKSLPPEPQRRPKRTA